VKRSPIFVFVCNYRWFITHLNNQNHPSQKEKFKNGIHLGLQPTKQPLY